MLVGALGDEHTGLSQQGDAQQADDREEGLAEGGATVPPPAGLQRTKQGGPGSGDIPLPEIPSDADPAKLVGALGEERLGLDDEGDEPEDL
jgi:hypothetical protein